MRRWLPHGLVALGLLVGLGVGIWFAVRGGGEEAAPPPPPPATTAPPSTTAPPPSTTAPPPSTTAPPAPPPPVSTTAPNGLAFTALSASSLSQYTATISWATTMPADVTLAWGLPDAGPTLWTRSAGQSVPLPGLSAGTPYRVWATAAAGGYQVQATLDLQTPAPASPTATVSGDTIQLDGQPFFPLMVWSLCPNGYEPALLVGINLFAENPCNPDLAEQLGALAGKALSAGVIGQAPATGTGLIGWFYPDEGDAKGLVPEAMQPPPPGAPGGGITLLTLSNHFYSGAAPLPQGRGMYPGLVARAQVVGFDLYPLQEWCRPDRLAEVLSAQQELVRLAAGKPTFQWIEAGPMKCPNVAVTPEVVRAESWLAVVGGARGLGFFPSEWQPPIQQAITQVTHDVKALGPALLAAPTPASASGGVRVAARAYGGALYVIAVNPASGPARAELRVPGLGGRAVSVLGEGRQVQASGGAFTDAFGPLGVHLYIAPPS
jgi:hypothetical protein